jgi:hypothetical protein
VVEHELLLKVQHQVRHQRLHQPCTQPHPCHECRWSHAEKTADVVGHRASLMIVALSIATP